MTEQEIRTKLEDMYDKLTQTESPVIITGRGGAVLAEKTFRLALKEMSGQPKVLTPQEEAAIEDMYPEDGAYEVTSMGINKLGNT